MNLQQKLDLQRYRDSAERDVAKKDKLRHNLRWFKKIIILGSR